MKEWFAEWFDSPYYHQLYQNHDDSTAQTELSKLLTAIDLHHNSRVMDLACGKGRHSRYLAEKGFDVTGLDISFKSISFAKQFETDTLHFYQHDMRLPFRFNYYDAILNFFTSFGYFESEKDHLRALQNVAKGLHKDGIFLLDFFNSIWVRSKMVPNASKIVDGITFHLHKRIEGNYIYKTVHFEAEGQKYEFEEKVRLFELVDFETLFTSAGLTIQNTYGNYDLSAYNPADSPRLILIATKAP